MASVLALMRQLDGRGFDVEALVCQCRIDSGRLNDAMGLVPLVQMAALLAAAVQNSGDCRLPLKLAEDTEAGVSGLVGHLVSSAPSVRTFLECLAGYSPLLFTGCEYGFARQAGSGTLMWRPPAKLEAPLKPLSLYLAASVVARVRLAAGETWVPLAVSFDHKAPAGGTAELERVFGSRLTFDADCTSITFDGATMAQSMPTANEELFAIYRHHAYLLMREVVFDTDLPTRVRKAIIERLTEDSAALEAVARDLGISPRSLQRRLIAAGTSFERVLDETRCVLAERLLRETDRPIKHVAHEVGYGSQSTFTRAVRRWLSVSPAAYRQSCRRAVNS